MRGNMIHLDEIWEQLPWERGTQDGECCGEKRSSTKGVEEVQKEKEEGQVKAEERQKRSE